MNIPKLTLDEQIKIAQKSLEDARKRLQDRLKWVEEAKHEVEIWESFVGSLTDYNKCGY